MYCKINNKDLRFRVGEIVSLRVEEFYKFMGCYFLQVDEFVSLWGLDFIS